MATKVTQKKTAAAPAEETQSIQVIYLVAARTYRHNGLLFEKGKAYKVLENLADFLTSVELTPQCPVFEYATKRQQNLPVVDYTGAAPSKVTPAVTDIGGELDQELIDHLNKGAQTPAGSDASTEDGDDDESGTGEKDIISV